MIKALTTALKKWTSCSKPFEYTNDVEKHLSKTYDKYTIWRWRYETQ